MSILKVKSKTRQPVTQRTVGVPLPPHLHAYLSLYALARGITRASILRREIEHWYGDQCKIIKEDDLVEEIIKKIQFHIKGRQTLHPRMSLEELRETVLNDLERKGLCDEHIKKIMKEAG